MGSSPRILYWCAETTKLPFETGIQRVTRRLDEALRRQGVDVVPVGWNPTTRLIDVLPPRARAVTAGDFWEQADFLLLPELPVTLLAENLDPIQLARAYGLRSVAIVHDLIPIRLSHLYSAQEQALFKRYFSLFAQADLVLATTNLVASHLRDHLASEKLRIPDIAVVPLPAQFADSPRVTTPSPPRGLNEPLQLLTVSTWEPRKNLPGLLRAIRSARETARSRIDFTLVGRREVNGDLDAEMDAMLAELPGCGTRHRIGDAELAALYSTHHASIYPSCEEGFGMPVLESLWLGRPCVCHYASAMAEVAPGGGTMMIDMSDTNAIAASLRQLAHEPHLINTLTREALMRPLRDWASYAKEVAAHLL